MLDCVQRGCPTDETLCALQQRVIQVSISDKFHELQESGQTPVCLLSTRKACCDINNEMLAQLTSEVHEVLCIDEVDKTSGTLKWNKKAAEQLEKLNRDCNMKRAWKPSFLWLLEHESCCVATLTQRQA